MMHPLAMEEVLKTIESSFYLVGLTIILTRIGGFVQTGLNVQNNIHQLDASI